MAPRPDISKAEYRDNINRLIMVLEGKTKTVLKQLEVDMKRLSKQQQFEHAGHLRNQYLALKALSTKIIFGREETFDLTLDIALNGLAEILGLPKPPRRMECYDISNFAGGDAVSSMVVFTDGVPDQKSYRHFKMRTRGTSPATHLVQRIRDEAHRFAVSYHKVVRNRRTKASALDEIVGVGPVTRKKLIRNFGSIAAVRMASEQEISLVVGVSKAHQIHQALSSLRSVQ